MKKTKWAIRLFVLFVVLSITGYLVFNSTAENPTAFKVKVRKVELFQDKNSSPVVVFENSSGVEADLINHPGFLFGEGRVPAGTYKRIRFTIDPTLTYSGPNPCSQGSNLTDRTFDIGSDTLVFATAEDGGGSGWHNNGSMDSPFLMLNPIQVEADATTKVRISFNTEGILQCVNNQVTVLPPTISVTHWVETPAPEVCQFPADYWFVHFNISTGIHCGFEGSEWVCRDDSGKPIRLDNLTDVLQAIEVISGWGKITMNNDGTATVDPSKTAENGGMAEHRHNLFYYDPNDPNSDEGYHNPLEPQGGPMSMKYVISGRKVIFFMGEGALIEGYFNRTCDVFIGTNWSDRDNDVIYAVKVPQNLSSDIPAGKYILSGPYFGINYDDNTHTVNHLHFDGGIVLLNVSNNSANMFEWTTYFGIPYSNNTLTLRRPLEDSSYDPNFDISLQFTPEGILKGNIPEFEDFVAVNSKYVGIVAGATRDYRPEQFGNYHHLFAGSFMKLLETPQVSDLDGTWYFVVFEAQANPGSDSSWETGDEKLEYGITKGELTFSNGKVVSASTIYKDSLTGNIEYSSLSEPIQGTLTEECYYPDRDLSNTQNCPGITMKVFKFPLDPDTDRDLRMVLDPTKTVLVFWDTIDVDDPDTGSIKDRPQTSDYQNQNYYYGSPYAVRGYAVKIQ